jgi:hypothetical protein
MASFTDTTSFQVKNIFGWGYDSQSLVALDNVSW